MTDTALERLDELTGRVRGLEGRLRTVERGLRWRVPSAIGTEDEEEDCATPPVPSAHPELEDNRVVALRSEPDVRKALPAPPPLIPIAPTSETIGGDLWARALARQTVERNMAASRTRGANDLESAIGRNWTSWVGAIVVVIGTCFFLKYAWDQGWLAMPPAARVAGTIVAGVLFGAAGEWVRRRDMRGLAGTLGGLGVAITMAAFFAAATMFDEPVMSTRAAMVGVCITAAMGIWRAVGMNVMALAIVAMLGAYLAPAVLRSGRDESGLLMGYLGVLGMVGWCLAYARPRWHAVRWFVWSCTALWVGAWLMWYRARGTHAPLGIGVVTFFFAGFVGEAYLTVARLLRGIASEPRPIGLAARAGEREWLENALATMSMLSTGAAFAAFFVLLPAEPSSGWLHFSTIAAVALGLACLHAVIAVTTPSRVFARSSLLQAAALVTLAVPLALGGVAITLAWLVGALALAGLAFVTRLGGAAVRIWAIALLGLAAGRLFSVDLMDASLRVVIWQIGEQGVSYWLMLAFGVAIAGHGVAWLLAPRSDADAILTQTAALLAAAGSAALFVASAMHWRGEGLTLLWLMWTALLVMLARRGEALGYAAHAATALAVVACKWIALDGIGPIVAHWSEPGRVPPVWNGVTLAGGVIAILAARLGAGAADAKTREHVPVAVGLVAFALLNFETLRAVDYFSGAFADFVTAKLVALSVLWATVGLVAVIVGFAKRLRPLRYAALGLLGVTLGKILFVDLAQVRPVYRILSFLAVGGLLLCVSFVYHKQGDGQWQKSNVESGEPGA